MLAAAASLNPKSAQIWDELGLSEAAQGKDRLRDAFRRFQEAQRLDPDSKEIRIHLDKAARELAPDMPATSQPAEMPDRH
jgi:cytochrome c-type biogenesis protein CcmH/NrfG